MIEQKRKIELKTSARKEVTEILTSIAKNDEEFLYCLLLTQAFVSNCLFDFKDDIYLKEEE